MSRPSSVVLMIVLLAMHPGLFVVPSGKYRTRLLRQVPIDHIIRHYINASNTYFPGLSTAAIQYVGFLQAHPGECIVPFGRFRNMYVKDVYDRRWMQWSCTANSYGMRRTRKRHPRFMQVLKWRMWWMELQRGSVGIEGAALTNNPRLEYR